MEKALLNQLFEEARAPIDEYDQNEEVVILLNFRYAGKVFTTVIDLVKEIVDFPVFVPFPHKTDFLGVFNLRGSIVPIFNPLQAHISQNDQRQRLIVFEVERGELVAIPASSITKKEIEEEELQRDPDFVTIDGVPFERFDITQYLKEAA